MNPDFLIIKSVSLLATQFQWTCIIANQVKVNIGKSYHSFIVSSVNIHDISRRLLDCSSQGSCVQTAENHAAAPSACVLVTTQPCLHSLHLSLLLRNMPLSLNFLTPFVLSSYMLRILLNALYYLNESNYLSYYQENESWTIKLSLIHARVAASTSKFISESFELYFLCSFTWLLIISTPALYDKGLSQTMSCRKHTIQAALSYLPLQDVQAGLRTNKCLVKIEPMQANG